jgi:hypothetical protein
MVSGVSCLPQCLSTRHTCPLAGCVTITPHTLKPRLACVVDASLALQQQHSSWTHGCSLVGHKLDRAL